MGSRRSNAEPGAPPEPRPPRDHGARPRAQARRAREADKKLAAANTELRRRMAEGKSLESERRAAERGLHEVHARFESAFASAPIGMALVDMEGRWLQVNDALCRITGHTRAELQGDDAAGPDPSRGRRSRRGLPARAARRPDSQLPDREALPPRVGPLRLGAVDRLARPRRPGQGPLRRLPGPGHLRAEGAGAAPRVPDRSRLPDRALQPAPLRAGAGAGGRAGGALRRPGRRARDRPGQLQGRQRHLRPQGGRRPAQGRGGRREASHPPDGPSGAARRGRVRGAPSPGGCRPGPESRRTGSSRRWAGTSRCSGTESIRVTASVGVAMFDGLSAAEVLACADLAMYEAKEAGRNRFALYSPARGRAGAGSARQTEAERLRTALRGRSLRPVRSADPRPAGRPRFASTRSCCASGTTRAASRSRPARSCTSPSASG